jgi:hypothetical protein
VGKRNPLTSLGGMQISRDTIEKIWRFLRKLKIKLLYNPAKPLLGI